MPERVTSVVYLTAKLTTVGTLKAQLTGVKRFEFTLGFGEQVILANTVFTYLGTVANIPGLPANPRNGDTYYVTAEQTYYAWMGERWMDIGAATMCEQLTAEQKAYLKSLVGY